MDKSQKVLSDFVRNSSEYTRRNLPSIHVRTHYVCFVTALVPNVPTNVRLVSCGTDATWITSLVANLAWSFG